MQTPKNILIGLATMKAYRWNINDKAESAEETNIEEAKKLRKTEREMWDAESKIVDFVADTFFDRDWLAAAKAYEDMVYFDDESGTWCVSF